MHDRLQRLARDHLLLHFAPNGAFGPDAMELLVLERGEGVYVFDTAGRRYLDGISSLFCAQLGYSYGEEIAATAAAQLSGLAFNSHYSTSHVPGIELAERLAELAPGDLNRAFFVSGGSEAVDAAWKIARLFHVANGEPQRTRAIARVGAYHGVTLGALSFTGVPGAKAPYGRPAIDVTHVSNTDRFRSPGANDPLAFTDGLLAEIEATILGLGPDTVGLIVAEPVQNAGGSLAPPPGYWPGLRRIADRYGILLLADEVITGFGRMGEYFASDRVGAQPDLVTLAKGMTSAHAPLGCVMVSDRIAAPLYEDGRVLSHGHTFGGHPLSAAIALKNIEIFERDGVLANARALEPHLRSRLGELAALEIVGDVRGLGLLWSLELVADEDGTPFDADQAAELVLRTLPQALLEHGVIAKPDARGATVVTLAPPLVSSPEEIDAMVDAVGAALLAVSPRALSRGGRVRDGRICEDESRPQSV